MSESPVVTGPFTVTAPGRVNLIGEHTDYNDGFVLPMAIERHVMIDVRPRSDRVAVWRSDLPAGQSTAADGEAITLDLSRKLEPPAAGQRHWSDYPAGVIAGFQRLGWEIPGFEARVSATLPAGAGLSSSAALEVATATALETLCRRSMSPEDKALLCQQAEHEFAGVPCGIMDQFAVCLARAGHAQLLDCRSRQIRQIPLDIAASVLVFNSGVKHTLADGEYAKRRLECAAAADLLGVRSLRDVDAARFGERIALLPERQRCRARHVIAENIRVGEFVEALENRDWPTAGRKMVESHWSLSDDYQVSCPELDLIASIAASLPGVYGCRMTGGGFGGCAVALVAATSAVETGRALHNSYRETTGIDAEWFLTAAAHGPRVTAGSAA